MLVSNVFLGVAAMVGFTVAHEGMTNIPGFRDVGVVFDKPNYQGESTYLLLAKNQNPCYPLAPNSASSQSPVGVDIGSIQICHPTTCALFSSPDCSKVDNGLIVKIEGPCDIPEKLTLEYGVEFRFKSYICGEDAKNVEANMIFHPQQGHEGHFEVEDDA